MMDQVQRNVSAPQIEATSHGSQVSGVLLQRRHSRKEGRSMDCDVREKVMSSAYTIDKPRQYLVSKFDGFLGGESSINSGHDSNSHSYYKRINKAIVCRHERTVSDISLDDCFDDSKLYSARVRHERKVSDLSLDDCFYESSHCSGSQQTYGSTEDGSSSKHTGSWGRSDYFPNIPFRRASLLNSVPMDIPPTVPEEQQQALAPVVVRRYFSNSSHESNKAPVPPRRCASNGSSKSSSEGSHYTQDTAPSPPMRKKSVNHNPRLQALQQEFDQPQQLQDQQNSLPKSFPFQLNGSPRAVSQPLESLRSNGSHRREKSTEDVVPSVPMRKKSRGPQFSALKIWK